VNQVLYLIIFSVAILVWVCGWPFFFFFFFFATVVVWAVIIMVLDFFFLQLSYSGLAVEFFFATVVDWDVAILVLLDFFFFVCTCHILVWVVVILVLLGNLAR
jgi:hypothetical protein